MSLEAVLAQTPVVAMFPTVSTPSEVLSATPSPEQTYLDGLIRERDNLLVGPHVELTRRLVDQEIERIQKEGRISRTDDSSKMADVTKDKSIKLSVKVLVPVREHPKFNFVGKLLGPKGNSLKRLQEETLTKMAILGRGSMRDKQKEEELRLSGDSRFSHLSEDLHVEVTSVAPPAEAHARIAYALTEIRRYLVPDYNDEIRQEQMREMQLLHKSPPTESPETNNNRKEDKTSDDEMSITNGQLSPHATATQDKRQALSGKPRRNNVLPSTSITGSRRSVLSLLTKARAMQQKEQELLKVFPDISPSYNVFDHINEMQVPDTTIDSFSARNGALLKPTPTNHRVRFRFDPYPKLASST